MNKMNTTTESYAGILKLLLAYELQHTLNQDEFLAVEHFQRLDYWLETIEIGLEDTSTFVMPQGLAVWIDDSDPRYPVVYVLRQGEA